MGASEDRASPDQPRTGLIDQWLAHHDEEPDAASMPRRLPDVAAQPVASIKDRLAAARREKLRREGVSPDDAGRVGPVPEPGSAELGRAEPGRAEPGRAEPGRAELGSAPVTARPAPRAADSAPAPRPAPAANGPDAAPADSDADPVLAAKLAALRAAEAEREVQAPRAEAGAEPVEARAEFGAQAEADVDPQTSPDVEAQAEASAAGPTPALNLGAPASAASSAMAEDQAGRSFKDRLAARRAALAGNRRDASAEVLGALGAAPQAAASDPMGSSGAAAVPEQVEHAGGVGSFDSTHSEPTEDRGESAGADIAAAPGAEAPMTEVPPAAEAGQPTEATGDSREPVEPAPAPHDRAEQRKGNGKHKASLPEPPPVEETDGSLDPALQAALRAVEAAETAEPPSPKRGLLRRNRGRGLPGRLAATQEPPTTPQPPARPRPEFPPAPPPTVVDAAETATLDPAVAGALEAAIDARARRRQEASTRSVSARKRAVEEEPARRAPTDPTDEELRELIVRSADQARAERQTALAAASEHQLPADADDAADAADAADGAVTGDASAVADEAVEADAVTAEAVEAEADGIEADAVATDTDAVADDRVGGEVVADEATGDLPEVASESARAESTPTTPAEPAPFASPDRSERPTGHTIDAAPTELTEEHVEVETSDEPAAADIALETPTVSDDVPSRRAEPPTERNAPPTRPPGDSGLRLPVRDLADAPTSPKSPPGVVQFSPRRSTRQLLGMLLLLCLAGAVGTGFLAWDTRGTTEIAIAGTLALTTLILWSAFSTAAPARLSIDRGVLDVTARESRHRFDLASPYTEVTVNGRPGKRGWQVLIHRRSMKPFVIDSSMVDPAEFQAVLDHYREIAEEAALDNRRRREQR